MITTNTVLTKQQQAEISPDKAIELLKEGNSRFTSGNSIQRDVLMQAKDSANGQSPFAAVVGCIDSRAPIETLFDASVGDMFVARVAGNVINEDILGSLEYATAAVNTPLIVVLGHTSCGAVNAAIQNVQLGHVNGLTAKIQKAVVHTKMEHKEADEATVSAKTIEQNAHNGVEEIYMRSTIIRDLVHQGKVKIVPAVYHIDSGKVEFL